MNVGYNVGHYMKSRSRPRFGNLLEKLILKSASWESHV